MITREVALQLVDYIVTHTQDDPDVQWLLNNARLHVVPSVNVDGSDASIPGDCSSMVGRSAKPKQNKTSFYYHICCIFSLILVSNDVTRHEERR